MRKLILFALAVVCANAQYVTVTASNLKDASGAPANGTIHFQPHSSVQLTGQGQVTGKQILVSVTNGAFSTQLADTTQTTPSSCYDVYVTDALKRVTLGDPAFTAATGYQCVTTTNTWCTAGVCNFDLYVPNGGAGIANIAGAGPVYSVAGKVGDVILTHLDISDWNSATAGLGGGSGGTATVTEYIDMSANGVNANGSTDNRSAINAVLAMVSANGNGQNHRLYFPPGTYAISDTIFVPTKTEVYGNGPGDPTAGGTSFIPTAGFPAGHPMFQFGTSSSTIIQRSSLHDVTLSCLSNAGVGVLKYNAQEQTSIHNMVIFGCGDTGLRIRGTNSCGGIGGCNGYSEHDGPDHDLEIYPDHYGTANTTCFDIADDQNYHGIEHTTCAMGSYTTQPNYGGLFGCSGCSISGVHFESAQNGVRLGVSGTQGIGHAQFANVDGTTGVGGGVIEIDPNTSNQPSDLHFRGISGGAVAIKNLAYPQFGDCGSSMDIGTQSGGSVTVRCGDLNSTQNIFENWWLWRGVNSQVSGNIWCNRYNSTPFSNYCISSQLDSDSAHRMVFGGNASGGGDTLFNNPYRTLALSQSNTENGLNLIGAGADTSNSLQSMVANNLRYNHSTGKYILPGNGSGEADGYISLNPGGINPPRANLGGYGIFSNVGLTEGGTGYAQTALNTWLNAAFPTWGGMLLFGEYRTRPTCDATHRETMWFNYDAGNTADSMSFCGYSGGVLGWQGFGGGGGGGTGTITSVNGQTGPTVYLPPAVNGQGTTVQQNGTGNTATIQINAGMTPRQLTSGSSDSIVGTDCGGVVIYKAPNTVAVGLGQPTQGNIYLGCAIRVITTRNTGNVVITPSSSVIYGTPGSVTGASSITLNQTAGTRSCVFTAIDSASWSMGCDVN